MTLIADIMTRSVATVSRDDTLQHAAQRMREMDIGALPVLDGSAVCGMLTDRDIAIRGVAEGMVPQEALVSDVMSESVQLLRTTDTVEEAMALMGDAQVRRLPVLDPDGSLAGIVALADLATRQRADTDETLREISTPDDAAA
jgi:CBS-domain-containing membrane protein